jgi:MFS family permease
MLFFGSFNMMIPELSDYLTQLGGAEWKGLIISLFTVTAMISRPFSGKLVDTIGRVPVMMVGALVCFACSIAYPMLTTVWGFLLLRLIHGFSTGFTPTGQTTYVADIIPPHKRGEAMGLMGTAGQLGIAGGATFGSIVTSLFGYQWMFYGSSILAIMSVAILYSVKETLTSKQPFTIKTIRINREDVFEPRVVLPCVVMVLSMYAYGVMFTLIPDLGNFVGIENKGSLFACLTIASLTVRLMGGKASDRWGRIPVLKFSAMVMVTAMTVLAVASSLWMVVLGTILYGISQGVTSPTLMAWATDLSDTRYKGRGISSLFIFMEMGIGIGAFSAGLMYNNNPANFYIAFSSSALLSIVALVVLLSNQQVKPSPL